ncbi:MAG TPA: O-antigen ligase family protein [Gemmatimonadaceae bacterium]|nr:O-antigen ligase family protein [Gemmatimonadaceae bacterium]
MSTAARPAFGIAPAARSRKAALSPIDTWARAAIVFILLVWGASFSIGFGHSLAILTALGYVAVIVGIYQPSIGVLGIGLLCTLDSVARIFVYSGADGNGPLPWNTFNYWLFAVMLLFSPFLLRLRDLHMRTLELFVALLSVQLLISPSLQEGLQHVVGIASVFGMMVYFARVKHDRRVWYWLGVICGLLGAIGTLVFLVLRHRLPYVNPNTWSYLPLTALFAICMAFPLVRGVGRAQLGLALLASANLMWVLLSASRGSILLAICCAVYLMLELRGMGRRSIVLGLAVIVALVTFAEFPALREHTFHRVDKLLDPSYSMAQRTSGRSDLVLGAWEIFREHPLGVGTGGFSVAWAELGQHAGTSGFGRWEEKQAHSGWAKTLAENGLLGVLLLASFVGSYLAIGVRLRTRYAFLFGALVSTVLAAAFVSTEFQSKGLWMLAAGAATLLQCRWARRAPQRMRGRTRLRAPITARMNGRTNGATPDASDEPTTHA